MVNYMIKFGMLTSLAKSCLHKFGCPVVTPLPSLSAILKSEIWSDAGKRRDNRSCLLLL